MESTSSRELQIAEKIAPFIEKLASLVEDTNHDDLIRWSDDGMSFIVVDKKEFVDKLLPEMFKHQNFPSFVRQLNMYGFQKVPPMPVTVDREGERRAPMDMTEYRHPYFIRGRPRLLFRIKRNQSRRELAAPPPPLPGRVDGIMTAGGHPMQMGGPSRQDNHQLASSGFNAQGLNMQTRDAQSLRDNLREAREQQGVITRAINGLHGANRGLSDQNLVFQRLHDQHEHSINAILDYMVLLLPRSFNDYINGPEGSGVTLGQDPLSAQQRRDHHRTTGSPGHVLDGNRRDYLTQHGSNSLWDPVSASDAPARSTMTGAPPHERTADASQAGLYGLTGRCHDVQTASSSDGCDTFGREATLHEQPHHHRSFGYEQLRAMQENQDTRISNIRTMVHTLSPRIGEAGNIHAPGPIDDTGTCVPCGEARCQTHSRRDDAKCENTAPPDDQKVEQKGDVDYFSWPSSQYR
ncbi:hypothetical protein EsDP_00003747 [Epichloe bromicola]|uniref:HSF-type DNA-binding domain-containing protein n=1 Tax=Epichloe bromicola TaxID=79588 RepID=A0ABQ0CPN3_9HYPO